VYAINKLQSNRSIYQVDVLSVNFRLESVIGGNPRDVRVVARSEALLLKTYGADIPNPVGDEVNGEVDSVSIDILKKFQPVVLEDVYPARVAADGNCLYRAISKVICGNEALFILLRIFTLLEILSYPMFYDCDHKRFVDLISDNRIVVSTYIQLAKDVGKMGAYADMMHMYALSAVLKVPIRSYYPPQLAAEFVSQPHSRKICGRGVNVSGIPLCTVMWTQCVKLVGSAFVPNHFVPLLKKKTENEPDVFVVDLEEHHNEQPLSDIDDASDDGSITNFIDTTDDVHPLSNGCLSKQFLEIEYVIDLLTTYKYSESHNKIPEGTKSDVFFMVKNDRNLVSRDKGQRSSFSDDCGIWDSSKGSSPRTYFMTLPDGKLKAVYKKGDKFCDAKKVKGKKTFTPIESQPENVIELVRNYSVLKKDATYRRRVSWLGIGARESIALVEYFGKFPGLSQHGNGKEGTEYIINFSRSRSFSVHETFETKRKATTNRRLH
jgi:hypothetical protein